MSGASSEGSDRLCNQENFDTLLVWLHPDRDRAAEKHEEIRFKLIKIFGRRGCIAAEELADETIDRVCRKVRQIADDYEGDPALYFYGVAHKIYLEYVKKKPVPDPLPAYIPPDNVEQRHQCLDHCMIGFSHEDRELILRYFQDDRKAKIDHRKELAETLQIPLNTLRVRIHRLKLALQECVLDCLKKAEA